MKTKKYLGCFLVSCIMLFTGCVYDQGNHCKERGEKISSLLEKANYCSVDSDCIFGSVSCFGGCDNLVNKKADLKSIEEYVRETSYIENCGPCVQLECAPINGTPTCRNSKCVIIPNEEIIPLINPSITPKAACEEKAGTIRNLLEEKNHCSANSDCKLVSFGCPFGCFNLVNANTDLGEVENAVAKYTTNCSSCIYSCAAPPSPEDIVCRNGKCIVENALNVSLISLSPNSSAMHEAECEKKAGEISELLEKDNYCFTGSDCKIVSFGCPFGCFNLVNTNADLTKVEESIAKYKDACSLCKYRCIVSPNQDEIACIGGKCVDNRSVDD